MYCVSGLFFLAKSHTRRITCIWTCLHSNRIVKYKWNCNEVEYITTDKDLSWTFQAPYSVNLRSCQRVVCFILNVFHVNTIVIECSNHWDTRWRKSTDKQFQHWYGYWLVVCSAPSHCLSHYQLILICSLRKQFKMILFIEDSIFFFTKMFFEKVVCKMAAIFNWFQFVKWPNTFTVSYRKSQTP